MLAEAEQVARRGLNGVRRRESSRYNEEGDCLSCLGFTLAVTGKSDEARAALERALESGRITLGPSRTRSYLAQLSLWMQAPDDARSLADRASQETQESDLRQADFIFAVRMQGAADLTLGDLARADEGLHHALTLAREVNLVEEELVTLIALAELRRRRNDPTGACELLEDAWDLAERGPFVVLHADAYNVLAHIKRDAGDNDAAVDAATKAYRLAWCDGPPFAYHWGLIAAQTHLQELSAHEPEMPPFDSDKHGPMPEVQIEPEDTH